MEKIRLGLIGVGGMGSHHLYYSHVRNKRIEIVAVCDIIEERATGAIENAHLEGAKAYTDWKEMIDNAELDAIDICTPNYLHSIIAVYALEKGLHVFCEKPDAVSVEEAEKMKAASEKSGKVLMCMRNNRYYSNSKYLKKLANAGEFGDLYCGRCGWIRRRGIPGKGGWFTTKAQSGGGPLIDLGVHMIDLSIWLMGNPTPVSVSGCTFNKFASDTTESDSEHSRFGDAVVGGTFDVEDLAMGFIRFDNGACLQIEFSWASNIEQEQRFVELRGTKGGFKWCDNGEARVFSEDNGKLTDNVYRCDMGNGHDEALKHFTSIVLDNAEKDYVPVQGVNMIKILSAMYESAATGKEVAL